MHYKEKKETGDSYVGFGASGVGFGAAMWGSEPLMWGSEVSFEIMGFGGKKCGAHGRRALPPLMGKVQLTTGSF